MDTAVPPHLKNQLSETHGDELDFSRMKKRGFSLIEIMVALAIIAIASTIVLHRHSEIIRQQYLLEEKLAAQWFLETKIAQIRLDQRLNRPIPSVKNYREDFEYSNTRYQLVVEAIETEDSEVQRIQIQIFRIEKDQKIGPIKQIVSYWSED